MEINVRVTHPPLTRNILSEELDTPGVRTIETWQDILDHANKRRQMQKKNLDDH